MNKEGKEESQQDSVGMGMTTTSSSKKLGPLMGMQTLEPPTGNGKRQETILPDVFLRYHDYRRDRNIIKMAPYKNYYQKEVLVPEIKETKFRDLIIDCEDGKVRVSSAFLASISTHMKDLIEIYQSENGKPLDSRITFPVSVSSLNQAMDLLYTGTCKSNSVEQDKEEIVKIFSAMGVPLSQNGNYRIDVGNDYDELIEKYSNAPMLKEVDVSSLSLSHLSIYCKNDLLKHGDGKMGSLVSNLKIGNASASQSLPKPTSFMPCQPQQNTNSTTGESEDAYSEKTEKLNDDMVNGNIFGNKVIINSWLENLQSPHSPNSSEGTSTSSDKDIHGFRKPIPRGGSCSSNISFYTSDEGNQDTNSTSTSSNDVPVDISKLTLGGQYDPETIKNCRVGFYKPKPFVPKKKVQKEFGKRSKPRSRSKSPAAAGAGALNTNK